MRRSAGVGAALAAVAFALLVALPATAKCDDNVDPAMRQTPVGDTVCGKPSPTPTPTPEPTGSSTPKPKETRPTTTHRTTPAPRASVLALEIPRSVFPPVPQLPIPSQQPFARDDGFGSAYAQPTGARADIAVNAGAGAYLMRIALLLAVSGGVGLWLWRARVRRWMVGLG